LEQALVREVKEETGVVVKSCVQVYQRVELGDGPQGVDFYDLESRKPTALAVG
jgi:8-oxo-dGTP pyrophosphatase MutT (NUDIX family)